MIFFKKGWRGSYLGLTIKVLALLNFEAREWGSQGGRGVEGRSFEGTNL